MIQIEIDSVVFAELSKRATGFNVTPNDVLRQILNVSAQSPANSDVFIQSSIIEYIKSQEFQSHREAIDRYLHVLGWLGIQHSENFSKIASTFQRGKRRYFAENETDILSSGDGISAKRIPKSNFWALVTLDNKTKRLILENFLEVLNYQNEDIRQVLSHIPDSNIRRNRSRTSDLLEKYLQKTGLGAPADHG